ncbi:MAG: hypothetical protein JSV58_06920, partial [Candidatus Bathyarchaeota archaeon]
MKRTAPLLLLFISTLLVFSSIAMSLAVPIAIAGNNNWSSIDIQVDHTVQIRDGGLVVINDTFRLSAMQGQSVESLQDFSAGFPFEYKSNLDYCFAFEESNPAEMMEVVHDAGLGTVGFYGVNVIFPGAGVDLSEGGSYNFTVVFVFSNLVSSEVFATNGDETAFFTAAFPTYPSLTHDSSCYV